MITNKNTPKFFFIFLLTHLILWTFIPSISNTNLPLDTIEALAWGSNLDWGFNKHPPLSAAAVQIFYLIFGPKDWAYYLLSQIFVVVAFFYVWKFSNEIFDNKIFGLLSVIIIEGIFFYNYTTPEFNVNVSQLPFWALTVYFFWRGINNKNFINWFLFGIFSALGFLSKYLFIYLLISFLIYLLLNLKKNKKILINYFLSVLISLIILIPHFIWLFENKFVTIFYGLSRSKTLDPEIINHILNPAVFIIKQIIILIPFIIMFFTLLKKIRFKIKINDKKTFYLISVTVIPVLLILLTSFFTGAKIRTMWITPFYLFFGTLFFTIFKKDIDLKKIKSFFVVFLIFFIISPLTYLSVSLFDQTKRTDYPGKEISRLVQNKWDDNFSNDIKIVVGDEWSAGNLSYHLSSRPKWLSELKNNVSILNEDQGVIYTGNPKILKKICPGIYGTIKPVGYCMIGRQ